jgi:hypothetical protein
MTFNRPFQTLRRAFGPAASIGLASLPLLVVAACANSEDAARPDPDDAAVIPSNPTDADASSDGSSDGGTDAPSLPCAVGNLCSVSTPLTSGAIAAINGRSKNDIWASGSNGALLHWSGQEWTALESDLRETLSSIFLTPDEMWGVAGTLVLRRGLAPDSVRTLKVDLVYSSVSYRSVAGIAALPGGDVYFGLAPGFNDGAVKYFAKLNFAAAKVTYQADAVHPLTNEAQSSVGARALFLVPDRALWLVGDNSAVVRYALSPSADGGAPSLARGVVVPVASRVSLRAAWGYDEHLWAAGEQGTVLHFDGAEWHTQTTGTVSTLNAIFGISPNDIWAVGEHGTVLHFDGSGWSTIAVGGLDDSFRAVWGSASDDVWIGGDSGMFHWGVLP